GRVPYVAPISGVVTELELKEGSMVTPEMVAMTITGLGSLWVIAEVPEAQAGWLRSGTHAMVRFPSLPGEVVHGSVEYVYPELNMETRTLRARITLQAPPAGVRPNMLANVDLVGESGDSVVNVPRSALIRGGGAADRVVVALGDGRFASRQVIAGAESGDRVAIVQGLREGEQVVTAAQFLLDSEANLDAGLERLGEGGEGGTPPAQPQADPHAAHRGD
ncbi:MAG: efflux RND transporter periplasmic adaptor subunit, partial [Steroidobacteraceae bacterium]